MTLAPRADVVGSLLGPPELAAARSDVAAGRIGPVELKQAEDRAVDAMLAMQEQAGVDVVTDGELRRSHFAGPLIDACDGLEDRGAPDRPYFGPDGSPVVNRTPRAVTGPLRLRRGLVTEEFAYTRGRTTKQVKVTLPSPTTIVAYWSPEHSREAYPDPFDLVADATEVVRQEIDELARLGCTSIQLDAPELATLVDDTVREHYAGLGIEPDRMLEEGAEALNELAGRSGVRFTLHLCKGSKHRGWGASGGYDRIARRVLGGSTNVDAFLLEYDDERSGTFDALGAVPDDKVVVLGAVSTRRAELEPVELIAARVEEAAKHFPREQLALSTQCGFASGLQGDAESLAFQRAKLTRVAEAAHTLWH